MDWLLMGGHGSFVWGSYALGLGVLIWNLVSARGDIRTAQRRHAERLDEESPE